jgi:hypothetical protein
MRETIENNYKIFSPTEVMKNLNIRLTNQKLSGYQFATCCYCLLNIKTLQLTFARAGHPYPILIRHAKLPEQLELRGSLLGVFENTGYIQQTIQLQSGDKLLLYSDGTEPSIGRFEDLSGFQFNEDFRKIADLPIVEMIDRLNTLVQNHKIKPSEMVNWLISSCCGNTKNDDVIPAKACIQVEKLDSRLRGNDKNLHSQQNLINHSPIINYQFTS